MGMETTKSEILWMCRPFCGRVCDGRGLRSMRLCRTSRGRHCRSGTPPRGSDYRSCGRAAGVHTPLGLDRRTIFTTYIIINHWSRNGFCVWANVDTDLCHVGIYRWVIGIKNGLDNYLDNWADTSYILTLKYRIIRFFWAKRGWAGKKWVI